MSQGFTLAVLDGCERLFQSLISSRIECAAFEKALSVLGHHTHHISQSSSVGGFLGSLLRRCNGAVLYVLYCQVPPQDRSTQPLCPRAAARLQSTCLSSTQYIYVHVRRNNNRMEQIMRYAMQAVGSDERCHQDCTQAWLGSNHTLHA